ncbi:MAG: hypothetical protein ABSC19_01735 [Syntrophorhabdales bacterium]|jgi:hypothetical protein
MRSRGFYTGTLRMELPWYNRRVRHTRFPEKGPGEYWLDYKGFYFVQEKANRGLIIPAESIIEVKLSLRHGITFCRRRILTIVWRNGGERMSSGFIVEDPDQVRQALITQGWA